MIIACLALFFSVTGASLAAGHYLITRESQIKPSVVREIESAPQLAVVRSESGYVSVPAGETAEGFALCPAGYQAVSGGTVVVVESDLATVSSSLYMPHVVMTGVSTDGWQASMENPETSAQTFVVQVVCATVAR